MTIITLQELQAVLSASKGAKIVTLTTITKPDLKKDCPYEGVYKISVVNGIVNWQYANVINRQLEKEGKEKSFVPQKRKWGTRLDNSPFVSHVNKEGKHKLYLEMKVERILSTEYKSNDGTVIPQEEIQEYLREKK